MTAVKTVPALNRRYAACRACGLSESEYAINLARTADGRLYCINCLQENLAAAATQPAARAALHPQILYLCNYEDIYGSPPAMWAQLPAA